MTRQHLIERILRQVYGDQPRDDSSITYNLVNEWMNTGIGIAAKQNYKESIQLDGIGYVNNSFYTTFKGLEVEPEENFTWKITLPQLPIGIGRNEGIATLQFKDANNKVSLPCIPLSENQKGYFQSMRPIAGKILFYPEGTFLYALSTIVLSNYTATVGMISGGNSNDLTSVLNVPDDMMNIIIDYVSKMLIMERNMPVDAANDGLDAIKTT
jgi:hypothetical protein